jgi:two-component system phosphate regulon sensor histidine kinase PhoR
MAETAQEQLVIIEDFLNISRLEQGRMKYDFGPLAMDKLVTELADEFKEIAKEHQTELTHEIKGTGPFTIRADYGKIKQVITNLVNNAVEKYAMGKKVHLSLESLGEGKGIRFTVSDTGLGMSKETIARLFKRFSRAKDIGDKAVASEGSGLGLFIAREMVLAHGGRIWAESAGEGKGSVFFLELPSVPVENSAQKFEEEDKKEEEK